MGLSVEFIHRGKDSLFEWKIWTDNFFSIIDNSMNIKPWKYPIAINGSNISFDKAAAIWQSKDPCLTSGLTIDQFFV